MDQKISGSYFDKRFFKAVSFAIFEQPIKFRFFKRVIGVDCKSVFRAKVAQSCISGGIGHKKTSRVVKHREAILKGVKSISEGCKLMILMSESNFSIFLPV
jgi:hypothetical protein